MLESFAEGALERTLRNEDAAGEKVCRLLGLLLARRALGAGVELADAAVVDDVLELVEQRQATALPRLAGVQGDDPDALGPVARA